MFIWLLSGGKRRFYVRIPAADIMYSTVRHESGVNAGRLHTYLMTVCIDLHIERPSRHLPARS